MPDHERREVMRLLSKAGGAHADLVGLMGRLLWRKWRAPHSYVRWAVLAALRACHLRAKPWPQAPPPRPNKLLVVLRGEAFRTGGWLSRDTGGALADQQADPCSEPKPTPKPKPNLGQSPSPTHGTRAVSWLST